MSFIFRPNDNLNIVAPAYRYLISSPTTFEVCINKGVKRGGLIKLRSYIEGSPQGPNSLWTIVSYRPDIDQIIISPVGAKAGCLFQRSISFECLRRDFDRLDNFKQQDCVANAQN